GWAGWGRSQRAAGGGAGPPPAFLAEYGDRLSRGDSLETFGMLRDWRRQGVRYLLSRSRVIDLNSAVDRSMLSLTQDHGHHAFLLQLGERVANAMGQVARDGY